MLRTLFPYVGGKARQAAWIARHVNATPHRLNAEPFCGSASVFFTKERSEFEILNDLDRKFAYLFQGLRTHLGEFMDFCSRIEYSKAAFDESYRHLRGNPESLPEWKLGAWALFQCAASHAGWPDGHSFAWRTAGSNPVVSWQTKVVKLLLYSERLQEAAFASQDALEFLDRCNKPGVLLYVDPPYFGAEHRYKVTKGKFDHEALAERLRRTRAKVILSHYYAEPYISLYGGWRYEMVPSCQSCKGATRDSPVGDKPVVEGLWFNY
jgi:DNA adenine methylase